MLENIRPAVKAEKLIFGVIFHRFNEVIHHLDKVVSKALKRQIPFPIPVGAVKIKYFHFAAHFYHLILFHYVIQLSFKENGFHQSLIFALEYHL